MLSDNMQSESISGYHNKACQRNGESHRHAEHVGYYSHQQRGYGSTHNTHYKI